MEDQKIIKDKLIDGKKIVSRFRGKLLKMIKGVGSKLMIIQFGIKLDKLSCIRVMN